VGFGVQTSSGFPGESPGLLYNYANWTELDLASVAFGHSMAVTTLQLAQGYSVIASGGILHPVTFQKAVAADPGTRVLPEEICAKIMTMLEKVVEPGGTAQRANVPLYRVAGKTGTAHKSTSSGYSEDKYLSLFAGMAPVSDPQLVLVVVIDEPQGGEYFGGLVAAPVYSSVMQGALRILDIAPDKIPDIKTTLLMADKATQIQPKTR
jgi:cell division protein FtsI (penicillin-binding protein 3)